MDSNRLKRYVSAISESGLSIYDPIEIGASDLWIPTQDLEALLQNGLKGFSLAGLPLRTRSKVLKEQVCRVLGYPVPASFSKTKPRFPGQDFDTYIQKANNLQIWNEEIDSNRRYAIIRVGQNDLVEQVKVITGATLVLLDRTGTLTQKYQARLLPGASSSELVSPCDTTNLSHLFGVLASPDFSDTNPTDIPRVESLLPIAEVFSRLKGLVGVSFKDSGIDQERNRGTELHKLVCQRLGYSNFQDDGQFPDVKNQLLEVKLQTSPTIDLGLVCPDSEAPLGISRLQDIQVRHCDVRYALLYGETDGQFVTITHLYLTTGEAFFSRFPKFGGREINRKLQIPLPSDFFGS